MAVRKNSKRRPVLVIHGGAASRVNRGATRIDIERSLQRILAEAYLLLEDGASARDAVVRAVELLENDPLFNAGRGSKLQSDGKIRMSAALMDGSRGRFSGCVNVEGVKSPIRLAEKLQSHSSRVLSESGAARFAKEAGLEFSSNYIPERVGEYKRLSKRGESVATRAQAAKKHRFGTVGAVALDSKGRLAAATSTGGRGFEYPHRVSDSPTVAGNFANCACAVSATGTGEEIVEAAAAAGICALVEHGITLPKAASKIIAQAKRKRAQFGLIAVDSEGRICASHSTPHLVWAAVCPGELRFNP